jgi:hypothetical protein
MESGTTIQTPAGRPGPSTEALRAASPPPRETAGQPRRPQIGDVLLVLVDIDILRPLTVTATGQASVQEGAPPQPVVNGVITCEPEDHTRPALRGWSAGLSRITGRPDRQSPFAYGEFLTQGTGWGQWRFR